MEDYTKTKSGPALLMVGIFCFFGGMFLILVSPCYCLTICYDHAGLPVYFIEPLHPDKFFWRGKFYGEPDDFRRFSFFSRAALELLLQAGKKPDIIHCHDWQTAFVVCLSVNVVNSCSSLRTSFFDSYLLFLCSAGPALLGLVCSQRVEYSQNLFHMS